MNLNLRFFFPIVIRVHFWACAGLLCYKPFSLYKKYFSHIKYVRAKNYLFLIVKIREFL